MADVEELDEKIIFRGIDQDGKIFRPSDWADRLASSLKSFEEESGKIKFDFDTAYACNIDGIKSLVLSKRVETGSPEAYEFVMNFVEKNNLMIMADRRNNRSENWEGEEQRQEVRYDIEQAKGLHE